MREEMVLRECVGAGMGVGESMRLCGWVCVCVCVIHMRSYKIRCGEWCVCV